ncbi:MAG: DUF3794 domain-containing protein [Oscillospiraceae bacterium]|jgi:hypothetical protein|nr:DUF3794 domain-containing protein [Oscillospiraceae bacterium]
MELKFKKSGHDYYEPLHFAPFSCEAMRENIVPDSCGDIARIVDTTGVVCLTNRELTGDGRFSASGSVEVSVLYIPEKEDGPRALHFQIPFQCYGEGQGGAECEFLDIRGELHGIDTRVLNPRKVLTRANLVLYPSGCRHVSLSVCTGVDEGTGEGVQLLCEKKHTRVAAGVREKEFTFTEELPLSPGRGGVEEILSTRVDIKGTDSKLIGSKLVVKGLISVSVLYREGGGRLAVLQQELPFSQIIEGNGFDEDCESEAAYRLLSVECRPGSEGAPEDAYVLTLELMLRTRVTVWREDEVSFIADLYSTAAPVACQTAELELSEDSQCGIRRQNVRELLETGVAVKSVVDMEIGCGGAQLSGGELKVPVWARCLYLDENDVLGSVHREFSAAIPTELPEGETDCQAEAACHGDVIANIMPEGIELRFPLECAVAASSRRRYICVSGGETEEEDPGREPAPSLILRKLGAGETLWSVAKQYRATCGGILAVNELEDETQITPDRLLLIPRAR